MNILKLPCLEEANLVFLYFNSSNKIHITEVTGESCKFPLNFTQASKKKIFERANRWISNFQCSKLVFVLTLNDRILKISLY